MARLLLVASLFFAGCATVGELGPRVPAPTLPPIGHFTLNGRIGVQLEDRGFSGGVRWTHAAAGDDLWILTPLGQAIAHIEGDGSSLTLTTSDQKTYRARSAAELTRQALGWELPLAGLRHWVTGRSDPRTPAQVSYDPAGRIARLWQDGWEIEYLAFTDTSSGALPRTLAAQRQGLRIRLTVDGWRFDPAPGAP